MASLFAAKRMRYVRSGVGILACSRRDFAAHQGCSQLRDSGGVTPHFPHQDLSSILSGSSHLALIPLEMNQHILFFSVSDVIKGSSFVELGYALLCLGVEPRQLQGVVLPI